MNKPYDYYKTAAEENETQAETLKRRIYALGTIRALWVAAFIAALVIFGDRGRNIWAVVTLVFALPFPALVVWQNRLSYRRLYAATVASLCRAELDGSDYDFSAFDGAADMADAGHSFAFDLDIFGDRSFFQSVNRTVTRRGREILAGWMLEPLHDKTQILRRQEAIKELSAQPGLRHDFYATGLLKRGDGSDAGTLTALLGRLDGFRVGTAWKIIAWLVPALWVVVGAGYFFGVTGNAVAVILFLASFAISTIKARQVNSLHDLTDKMAKIFSAYSHLIRILEDAQFESPVLQDIKAAIATPGEHRASRGIMRLSGTLNALDQRANMIVAIINIFIMRDIRIMMRLEKWNRQNRHHVTRWVEALGEFDALASLGGFAFNHPEYVYPQIADDFFVMSGEGLGHPLIRRDVCVKNDIRIETSPAFMIVTGANMAGKSTYLRTVGINFLLSCIGAPVCAERLAVFPASLVTSLRTSDSLPDNESYFYAELKRLKMMVDRLESGEKLFIILDEILKGTNSMDKQKGSLALIRRFISFGTCGIIATHDLVLGSLHDEFPDHVDNFRFEADITGGKLSFSYKLQPGVARNMNAWFLMRQMGITSP